MTFISPMKTLLAVSLSTALMAGCGGSSSSGTGDTQGSGDPGAGAFTTANYKTILKSGFSGLGSVSTSIDTFQESVIGSGSQNTFSLKTGKATVQEDATCGTGTGSVTVNTQTPGSVTAGDSIVGTFDNCATTFTGVSFSMDGGFSSTIQVATGGATTGNDSINGSLKNRVVYSNFVMDFEWGDTHTNINLNGDVTVSETISSPLTTSEILSDGLTMNLTEDGVQESFKLISMNAKFIENSSNSQEIDEVDLSFQETVDGALVTITFDTTVPFKTSAGQDNPYEGSATITSSAGGTIQLTANSDAETVNIKLDADGDGTFEFSEDSVPWSEIEDEDEVSQSS